MQSGQALSLVDSYRFPIRAPRANRGGAGRDRTRRARPAHLQAVAAPRAASGKAGRGTKSTAQSTAQSTAHRSGKEWMRPIVRAVIVVGEWLLLIADVFVHLYLI